jgi:N-methylhydantoinase A
MGLQSGSSATSLSDSTAHGASSAIRVGVDIGGTFTDIVVAGADGSIWTRKVSSTPDDYSLAIVQGLVNVMSQKKVRSSQFEEIVHGTTVATNAILEHKGARTGLITSNGFRDVLEIRRLRMPELYNLLYQKPVPLVPRYLRREVRERIDSRGDVICELDEEQVSDVLDAFAREGVESIAVCLINSYVNPEHERRIGEIVSAAADALPCSLSCDILPEVREYERTSTTVINAYVRPIVERYLRSLLSQLHAVGIDAPVLIMQSNGGILSAFAAMQKAVHIVESGPAAGVVAARMVASQAGLTNAIAFDMGGTTAKASLIDDGHLQVTSDFEVGAHLSSSGINLAGGGYAMKVPVIDISEVGAGGGSIIWIDDGGSLQIGPQSSGSVPGPVCYGLGGTRPTVTDANVVLGYLHPTALAGGSVPIDIALSVKAIESCISQRINLPLLQSAYAAHAVANIRMVGAIKAVSTQRGRDPRQSALIAFGGNGPVHAAGIAALLDIQRIVVPPSPGLLSAFGLLWADHEHHTVQTYYRPFQNLDFDELNAQLGLMKRKALGELTAEGYASERVVLRPSADVRYVGQGFELTIPLPAGPVNRGTLAELESAFSQRHEELYGHRSDGDPIQFVNLRLTAVGRRPSKTCMRPAVPEMSTNKAKEAQRSRHAYFQAVGTVVTPVIARGDIVGTALHGPVIVEEYDATIVIPPDWRAELDVFGNVVMNRNNGGAFSA